MGSSERETGRYEEEKEERLGARDIVMMEFPFSDLSSAKVRPALVVAELAGEDAIFCMITTSPYSERLSIPIDTTDFEEGSLFMPSYIRPTRLFTAHNSLVTHRMGRIGELKMAKVREALAFILGLSD